jgi:hypothetical protein
MRKKARAERMHARARGAVVRLSPTRNANDHAYAKCMYGRYCSVMQPSPTGDTYRRWKKSGGRERVCILDAAQPNVHLLLLVTDNMAPPRIG